MVEQVIRYSDGSETVIKYRGVIKDGELTTNEELAELNETKVKKSVGRPKKSVA